MSQQRPQQGPHDAWSQSSDSLARILAAKEHEADRKLAASLSSRMEQLQFQETLARRMAGATDIFELGRLLLRELTTALGASHAVLSIVAESQFLEVVASTHAVVPRYQVELIEEAFVVGEQLVIDSDDTLDWNTPGSSDLPSGVTIAAMPLFCVEGKPLGVLLIEGGLPREKTSWLAGFVQMASTGLEDCLAYGRIDQLIVDAVVAITSNHAAVLEGVAPLNGRHIRRVEQLALQISRELGLGPTMLKRVRLTALLHDMDARSIGEAFGALKRGKLTGQQWQAWMNDPFVGGIFPSPLANFQRLVDELAFLRCRWDGKGNNPPSQGDEIPLPARVVAVAEAFENLTGKRRHRTTLSIPDALEQIARLGGAQYDPAVVSALCRQFASLEIESRIARQAPRA